MKAHWDCSGQPQEAAAFVVLLEYVASEYGRLYGVPKRDRAALLHCARGLLDGIEHYISLRARDGYHGGDKDPYTEDAKRGAQALARAIKAVSK